MTSKYKKISDDKDLNSARNSAQKDDYKFRSKIKTESFIDSDCKNNSLIIENKNKEKFTNRKTESFIEMNSDSKNTSLIIDTKNKEKFTKNLLKDQTDVKSN